MKKKIMLTFETQDDYDSFVNEMKNDFKDEPGIIIEDETSIIFNFPDSNTYNSFNTENVVGQA